MKTSERFALNEWLTEYPENLTYDEILELLREEDESVTVWRWFECIPTTDLIENIDNTQQHFAAVTQEK